MNLRWLWLDHVPPGVELTAEERRELRRQSSHRRAIHPRTMDKHGSLIASIMGWSLLETALLLFVVLKVFPMAQAMGGGARLAIFLGLPLVICLPIWVMIALAFNRSQSVFVRQALNEMGHPVCVKCGYALRGLGKDMKHCPECGAAREAMP